MPSGAFIRIPVPFCPFHPVIVHDASRSLCPAGKPPRRRIRRGLRLLGPNRLPVFTSGGGPSYIFQPTFGYLLGFIGGAGFDGIYCPPSSGPVPSPARWRWFRRPRHRFTPAAWSIGLDRQRVPGHADQFVDALRLLLRLPIPGDIFLCIVAAFLARRVQRTIAA